METSRQSDCIIIHPMDTVAVALRDMRAGETVRDISAAFRLSEAAAFGHKFALRNIAEGESVVKFGFPIGVASQSIPIGAHVHTHNLKTNLSPETEFAYRPNANVETPLFPADELTFHGYLRENGSVGTRNEVWIINTVGCVNHAAQMIADICSKRFIACRI